MKTSETIEKIAGALSKAQAEMTGAKKESNNPFFKSMYSDLASVMEAISKPFADNELCFVQGAEFDESRISVKTRIIHSSGQWIESDTILPPTKNDAQGYGSAITYGKRYGLQSLAGVPSIDDDGNHAVKAATAKPIKKIAFASQKLSQALIGSVKGISDSIASGDYSVALEFWSELSVEEKQEIWVAPSKGGHFTTAERAVMQSADFKNGVVK